MEFLGTFGCIWSLKDVKQVIIGRAEHGSEVPQRRHEEARATCPERRTEVARISHPSRSDLPKRHPEVARVSMARRHEAKPGATSRSDLPRSLPIQSDPLERHTKVARDLSPGHTKNRPWSDFPERHLQVAPRYFAAENHDFLRTFLQFILDVLHLEKPMF
uniref:80A08_13 n=1 Tax=Brassica rapa subsp. pekinensis TaxID=51351 RepID=Q4ABQ4_BRARP|nr:80A08_13 [Brassica rapa subsp. pekinensis]